MGMTWRNLRTLIAFVFITECAGILGSLFTISAIPTWYAGLMKSASPPILEPIHYLPPVLKALFLAPKLRLVLNIIHYASDSASFFA